jgi:predicted permease
VLALMGGVAGVALAVWGVEALLSRIPAEVISTMPYLRTTSVESVTLAFTAGVSLLSGIVFGLAPAWKLSGDAPQEALKDTGGVSGTGRNRLGLALVTAQVSLSIVMLIGAGLMVKSLLHMLETDPGFRTDHLLAVRTFLPPSYDKKETVIQAAQQMQTALKQLPGVTDIGFSNLIALRGGNTVRMQAEGAPVQSAGEQPEGNVREASPTYFTALGARLLYGRYFAETDDAKAPQVVILNASLAKQLFGTENAVGKRLRYTYRPEEKYREVVGVIANVQENRGLDAGDKPAIYEPFLQSADSEVDFAVRTNGVPGQIAAAARRAVLSVNGAIAIIGIESVEQAIDSSYPTFLRRYPAMLASMFGFIALALAMIGLYGMISYSVSQRTREIGIRMALGAQKSDVLRLFMHQGARVTISGVAIGVVAALIVSRVISGLLFGVRPSDPQTFLVSAALLACMALVAVAVPAYRASRVDPNEALRHE